MHIAEVRFRPTLLADYSVIRFGLVSLLVSASRLSTTIVHKHT